MAGKLRIKVSAEHVEPFWMFVDNKECPYIVDIQQKIEQRMGNVAVSHLLLDGCLLPAGETSQVLRDNDVVIVHFTQDAGCEDESAVSSSHQLKQHRKRKRSDEDSPTENQTRQDIEDSFSSEIKKKKKSKKERHFDPSVVCELFKTSHKSHKKREKRHKKKTVAEQDVDRVFLENENGDSPEHSTPVASKTHDVQKKSNIKTLAINEKAPEEVLATSSIPVDEVTDSIVIEAKKTKRKRRSKKKVNEKNRPEAGQDSTKTTTVARQVPAEPRLPKWQQGKNKKIVFSSDESPSSGPSANIHVLATIDQQTDRSKDVRSQTSSQPSNSGCNSSFILSVPAASSPNKISSILQTSAVDSGGGEALSSSAATDKNMHEDVNYVNASAGTENCAKVENGGDDWYRNQQYWGKLIEERKSKRRCPSAMEKAINPVHLYTGGQHEVVEPNLVEYLKMSPEERGADVPPYVTATRLSNGAMLYTRSRLHTAASSEDIDWKTASPFRSLAPSSPATVSPFKTPGSPTPSRFCRPQAYSPNSPWPTPTAIVSTQETDCSTDVTSISGQGENTADGQETIVLTPLCREYSLFANLTAAPKVGDQIAYKVLEMGENYTPGISDYKEAEVLAYDPNSQSVTVRLLHLGSELAKKRSLGKFDLPEEEPVEDNVTLELSAMFEPKLISSQ